MIRQEWRHETRRGIATSGPWDDEPDKIHWVDGDSDLDCLIVRSPMGALCGYVGVPPGHPWHGQDYDDVDVVVHGGLTFASGCDENAPEGHGVCHVPAPGRPADVWWLGFDCAHCDDLVPIMAGVEDQLVGIFGNELSYRDVAYVTAQCAALAAQVRAAVPVGVAP